MSGVVKLDPVRLAGLEAFLGSLSDRCRRDAGSIGEDLAGTGESAAEEIAELIRLAEWARDQGEDVARRRRFIEAMPTDLPLPAFRFGRRAEAIEAADTLAVPLRRALSGDPPHWSDLEPLLAEVARGVHSPTFSARLLQRLGPRPSRDLPVLLHRSFAESHPGAAPTRDTEEHAVVRELLHQGLSLEGEHAVSTRWAMSFAGLDPRDEPKGGWPTNPGLEGKLDDLGYARDIVSIIIRAFQSGKMSATRLVGSTVLGLVGLTGDAADIAEDPSTVNVLDGAGSLLSVVAPATGPAAPFVYGGAAFVKFLAWCESTKRDVDDREVRTYNPDTGRWAYPSGSQTNPNVDEAGVPLPPH